MADQDRTQPPQFDDLIELRPKWALAAFAARCARRGLFLLAPSAGGTDEFRRAVAETEVAEQSAARDTWAGKTLSDYPDNPEDYEPGSPIDVGGLAAATALATRVWMHYFGEGRDYHCEYAAWSARRLTNVADQFNARAEAVAAMWSDRDALAREGCPHCVPPSYFGPLWPDGEPKVQAGG